MLSYKRALAFAAAAAASLTLSTVGRADMIAEYKRLNHARQLQAGGCGTSTAGTLQISTTECPGVLEIAAGASAGATML